MSNAVWGYSALMVAALLTANSATSAPIDRELMFQRCTDQVKSGKYFRAADRGEVHRFHLSTAVYSQEGRKNIGLILDEIAKRHPDALPTEIAYVLGTAHRETASTMRPIHEAMGCTSEACIHKYVGDYGQPKANGKSYYGRGFAQLTGDHNYQKFGKILGLTPESALYDNPDLALEPKTAAEILVVGMFDGAFTRKHKLSDYFGPDKAEWVLARKIVNPGSKRAPVTAGYGKLFYECITGETLVTNGQMIE
ncbi:TPA: hypothetical protein VDU83_002625 [Pseudomonas aeruginosa]|nr:hypothetical protein [Pseudomonas aeruginosa]